MPCDWSICPGACAPPLLPGCRHGTESLPCAMGFLSRIQGLRKRKKGLQKLPSLERLGRHLSPKGKTGPYSPVFSNEHMPRGGILERQDSPEPPPEQSPAQGDSPPDGGHGMQMGSMRTVMKEHPRMYSTHI